MPREQPALRKQLLAWLLAPLFLLLAVDTFVSYRVALAFAQRAYDRSLVEVARDLSLQLRGLKGGVALDLPPEARSILLEDPLDRVFHEVASADGRTVSGEPIAHAPDRALGPGRERLYDGEVRGERVRVVELAVPADGARGRPAATVRVAETMAARNALAREILASVVLPQALLIVVAGLVVWIGVVRGLSPLERLRRTLLARPNYAWHRVDTHDVPAELRPLLQAIDELGARLDSALTLQSRFIADAAHQLKTPITVLKTQLELVAREDDPARLRESLRASQAGLDRLSRVVSQLLSLARNEPDAIPAALAPLDLNALALEAATSWVPEALKKNIDLGFEGHGRPVTVHGDAARLRELLDNLIDNAVRYSREGGCVTVLVESAPTPAVQVNDDGPGIPVEERNRVFERFHRILGHAQGGSGLGLAIAREIASIHGATIEMRDDADGVGTAFRVAFPET